MGSTNKWGFVRIIGFLKGEGNQNEGIDQEIMARRGRWKPLRICFAYCAGFFSCDHRNRGRRNRLKPCLLQRSCEHNSYELSPDSELGHGTEEPALIPVGLWMQAEFDGRRHGPCEDSPPKSATVLYLRPGIQNRPFWDSEQGIPSHLMLTALKMQVL
jgi:hypothetical protein